MMFLILLIYDVYWIIIFVGLIFFLWFFGDVGIVVDWGWWFVGFLLWGGWGLVVFLVDVVLGDLGWEFCK